LRLSHFEQLQPICPRCRQQNEYSRLRIKRIEKQQQEHIINALLQCSSAHCAAVYPVIDAVPILVHPLADYLRNQCENINSRNDLGLDHEAMLGDASGIGSRFNQQRHYLSTYVTSHYGDCDSHSDGESPTFKSLLAQSFELLNRHAAGIDTGHGNILDIGCASGRSSFELAAHFRCLTLGLDLNFSLLRFAQQLLIDGKASYPRKHLGVIYHRHNVEFSRDHSELVDFWAADATALPLPPASSSLCGAYNVLDAVNSPRHLLHSLARQLKQNGTLLLTTPYDWSGNTPMQNWLGGQAQYDEQIGDSPQLLRQIMQQAGFDILAEKDNLAWQLRLHSRQFNHYQVHMLAAALRVQ